MAPALPAVPDRIETERLVLRSPMPGDGPAMNEAILETWNALHRWMPWAKTRPSVKETEETARQFREAFLARTDVPFFTFLRGRPTFAVGLVQLAFKKLGAERVEIHCSHLNEPSQRAAERCGFALEGRLRNHKREPDGKLRDTLVCALVAGDAAYHRSLRGRGRA